jgi:hypothetical protein
LSGQALPVQAIIPVRVTRYLSFVQRFVRSPMGVNALFHESRLCLLGEKSRVVGKKIVEGMITATVVVDDMPRQGESVTEYNDIAHQLGNLIRKDGFTFPCSRDRIMIWQEAEGSGPKVWSPSDSEAMTEIIKCCALTSPRISISLE